MQREQISGFTRGRLVTGQRKHRGRIVVLVLDLGRDRLDLEFLRLRLGGRHCQLEAGWENLQFLEGRVGVDRAAERLHVLGPDLGEVLHRLHVLPAHVADALQTAVRQCQVVLARLLGLLLVHLLVLELVHRVDGLGLETKRRKLRTLKKNGGTEFKENLSLMERWGEIEIIGNFMIDSSFVREIYIY